ncbi:MAG TPA: hypothetical protein VFD90_06485 [Gaiellales bacterium]|jgi:hypothetical protein|nr:hypothetical protein [Gaiellales bacterium]
MLASVAAVAACSLLATGCGGGGSPGVANVASSTSVAATTTPNGATTTQTGTIASAFAFARCMRSYGIPGWPDPNSQGFFDKSKLRPLGLSVSRVRALEEGPCNIPLPSPQAYTITPADRAAYLKAAACMRSHGFPDFPDPTFPDNNVTLNIPSSINRNSPRFKSAATTCTELIRPGLPYTRPGGS